METVDGDSIPSIRSTLGDSIQNLEDSTTSDKSGYEDDDEHWSEVKDKPVESVNSMMQPQNIEDLITENRKEITGTEDLTSKNSKELNCKIVTAVYLCTNPIYSSK